MAEREREGRRVLLFASSLPKRLHKQDRARPKPRMHARWISQVGDRDSVLGLAPAPPRMHIIRKLTRKQKWNSVPRIAVQDVGVPGCGLSTMPL